MVLRPRTGFRMQLELGDKERCPELGMGVRKDARDMAEN